MDTSLNWWPYTESTCAVTLSRSEKYCTPLQDRHRKRRSAMKLQTCAYDVSCWNGKRQQTVQKLPARTWMAIDMMSFNIAEANEAEVTKLHRASWTDVFEAPDWVVVVARSLTRLDGIPFPCATIEVLSTSCTSCSFVAKKPGKK